MRLIMSKKQIHQKNKKTVTVCTACRLLMLAVYGYSVFFWGSVTLAALFRGSYDGSAEPPGWVGVSMSCGWLLLTAAMLLSFFKKDITAFLLAAGGTAAFCAAGHWFVLAISDQLATKNVANDLLEMDREYAWRYFPSLAIPVAALLPAVVKVVQLLRKRKQAAETEGSKPVKSIID